MTRKKRIAVVTAAFFILFLSHATAQFIPDPGYRGLRISLFNIAVASNTRKNAELRCDIANTGRIAVKSKKQYRETPLVVEIDEHSLPSMLRGHEAAIRSAAEEMNLRLDPGEIKKDAVLSVKLFERRFDPDSTSKVQEILCPDLVFDTVYITEYSERSVRLKYRLHNAGNRVAQLLDPEGRSTEAVSLDVFFVTGAKKTRGALLAHTDYIRFGRETIDGYLPPGQFIEGEIDVPTRNRTKFSPNFIVEIDPLQKVDECNRTNNAFCVEAPYWD